MQEYPSLDALRKKDATAVAATAPSGSSVSSMLNANPLEIKKIKRRKGRRTALRVTVLSLALLVVASTVFSARMLTSGAGLFGDDNGQGFFASLRSLFGDTDPLIGEKQDRVNFLLLGHGGEGHDGPNLTDTIIVASLKPSTKEVAMLSIPRDLLVPIGDLGQNKINSAFATGEEGQYPGGGVQLTTETVEELTGLDIPYYVVIDFRGFEKIVDEFGGVEVDVPREFYDFLHGIQYDAGPTHFDGEEALYFVRARYVEGPEGGDFARAARTQLVLKSLRGKALQLNPVTDLSTISSLLNSVGEHVRTNVQIGEMKRLYELASEINVDTIKSRVIDEGETGLVYGTSVSIGGVNVSVLSPNDPTFAEIQAYAERMFDALPPAAENATLEIQNGTTTTGIAATLSNTLTTSAEIVAVSDADTDDYQASFIVDNTDGKMPETLKQLLDELSELGIEARVVTSTRYPNQSSADLLLVLGEDYVDCCTQ